MKELYYSPSIREFHIDFRYESYEFNDDTMEMEWRKRVFPEDGLCTTDKSGDPNLVELFYSTLKEDTRVKYLDQQDIEELGWIETPLPLTDRKSYYRLYFKLVVSEKGIHIFEIKDEGNFTLFFGQIRNFSELRRVMIQIGIV